MCSRHRRFASRRLQGTELPETAPLRVTCRLRLRRREPEGSPNWEPVSTRGCSARTLDRGFARQRVQHRRTYAAEWRRAQTRSQQTLLPNPTQGGPEGKRQALRWRQLRALREAFLRRTRLHTACRPSSHHAFEKPLHVYTVSQF